MTPTPTLRYLYLLPSTDIMSARSMRLAAFAAAHDLTHATLLRESVMPSDPDA
jgi:hypothetical protein